MHNVTFTLSTVEKIIFKTLLFLNNKKMFTFIFMDIKQDNYNMNIFFLCKLLRIMDDFARFLC